MFNGGDPQEWSVSLGLSGGFLLASLQEEDLGEPPNRALVCLWILSQNRPCLDFNSIHEPKKGHVSRAWAEKYFNETKY